MPLDFIPHYKPTNPPCPVCGSHGRGSKCTTRFPSGVTLCHVEKDVSYDDPKDKNSCDKWRTGKVGSFFVTFVPNPGFINPAIANDLADLTPEERRAVSLGMGALIGPQKPLGPAITAEEKKHQEARNKEGGFTVRYTEEERRDFTEVEYLRQSIWLWGLTPSQEIVSRKDIEALLDVKIVPDFYKPGPWPEYTWWTTVPEYDGAGNIIGYFRREFAEYPDPEDGKKGVAGGIRGITVLKNFDSTKPVWLFEGFTSTLTAGLCGINALGAPGVGNGLRFLLGLIPNKSTPIVIPIENDQKIGKDGQWKWPGLEAIKLAQQLNEAGYIDVKMCFLPDDSKDIRAFVKKMLQHKFALQELGEIVMAEERKSVDAIAIEANLKKKRNPLPPIDIFNDGILVGGGDGASLVSATNAIDIQKLIAATEPALPASLAKPKPPAVPLDDLPSIIGIPGPRPFCPCQMKVWMDRRDGGRIKERGVWWVPCKRNRCEACGPYKLQIFAYSMACAISNEVAAGHNAFFAYRFDPAYSNTVTDTLRNRGAHYCRIRGQIFTEIIATVKIESKHVSVREVTAQEAIEQIDLAIEKVDLTQNGCQTLTHCRAWRLLEDKDEDGGNNWQKDNSVVIRASSQDIREAFRQRGVKTWDVDSKNGSWTSLRCLIDDATADKIKQAIGDVVPQDIRDLDKWEIDWGPVIPLSSFWEKESRKTKTGFGQQVVGVCGGEPVFSNVNDDF